MSQKTQTTQQQALEAVFSKYLKNNSEKDLVDQLFQHLAIHSDFFDNHKTAKSTILSAFHSGNQTYQNIADDWEVLETEIEEQNQSKNKKNQASYTPPKEEKKINLAPLKQFENAKQEPVPVVTYKQPPIPIALPYYAPPSNNGGKNENYVWTQSLNELQVCLTLPIDIRAKDLFIQIRPHSVLIKVRKTGQILLKKNLLNTIDEFESYWMLEKRMSKDKDQKDVILYLQKLKEGANYWSAVFKGDPEIDVNQIVPTTSDLWLQQEAQNALPCAFDKVIRENAYSESQIMNDLARRNMINTMVSRSPELYSKVTIN